jgi:hypothetical protein
MKLRLFPFLIASVVYAALLGLCDYNRWGSWILGPKEVLELPFLALARNFPWSEGSVVAGPAYFVALVLNVFLWAAPVGLLLSRKKPNQLPEPTAAIGRGSS